MGKLTDKLKAKLKRLGLTEDGKEYVDPKPRHLQLGIKPKGSEPLHVIVKRAIRQNTDMYAMENGHETFEEANDFDIDDDIVIETRYERDFDTQVPDQVMQRHLEETKHKLAEQAKEISEMKLKLERKDESSNKSNSKKSD